MPNTTVAILLERLVELPPSGDLERACRRALKEYRRERESGGPITDEEWRGILLSARDLVHDVDLPRKSRAALIEGALDGEIVGSA